MATIQGFPVDFQFNGAALSNLYRHIGDAVPPLVSFQMACLVRWILGGKKPAVEELILPGTHLRKSDLTSNLFECA
jgi:DNA (cytosine-5)-methyltransferase 1